ncbi:MAG: TetR/AcrR family transcriptional regulator [Sphingobium sp.]
MKVSRDQAARNRRAVVDAASRLFRAHGVDGASIADIMRESGLSHGGFYNQFDSKDALAAEACSVSLAGGAARWQGIAAQAGEDALDAIAADYLSIRNRDAPDRGCALVAFGAESARNGGALTDAFRDGMLSLVAVLEQAGASRAGALARLSQLVGAMVLARAVKDEALSLEIMAAARAACSPATLD